MECLPPSLIHLVFSDWVSYWTRAHCLDWQGSPSNPSVSALSVGVTSVYYHDMIFFFCAFWESELRSSGFMINTLPTDPFPQAPKSARILSLECRSCERGLDGSLWVSLSRLQPPSPFLPSDTDCRINTICSICMSVQHPFLCLMAGSTFCSVKGRWATHRESKAPELGEEAHEGLCGAAATICGSSSLSRAGR